MNHMDMPIISAETIALCLELLSGISVPVGAPDADLKWQRLQCAYLELRAAATQTERGLE